MVFLAPMGAHNAIAIEAWQVIDHWSVETVDGTVNAVRYGTYTGLCMLSLPWVVFINR